MPRWLAWTLGALFVLALFLHAHQPLWVASAPGTGFSESDLRALLGVRECLQDGVPRADPRAYFAARESGLHPLAAASLALSTWIGSDGGALGAASPLPMRIENLVLLALAAAGTGVFLRRLVLPWVGDEHARAAAWVTAVLCVVHPLAYSAVVSLAARGDLLALALSSWSAAQFLRGRQHREARAGIRAGVLALLAGFASSLAWGLPWVLAAAEFVAGRRYRPWAARARTAGGTFLAYGACVAVEPLLRWLLGAAGGESGPERPAIEIFAMALEKLGVLALPVNPAAASFAAYLVAAALLVIGLEPAFSAARSAPRLWSVILASGAALVLAASFCASDVRVHPGNLTAAHALLPGLLLLSAGLALASTALTGLRRSLMPAILATGWAALANSHAGAWRASIESFDLARADVTRALVAEPRLAALCVLDVPEFVQGLAVIDRARSHGFLAAPELVARDAAELSSARSGATPDTWIAFPTRRAWVQFTRTPRFEELRARGFALALEETAGAARVVLHLPPAAESTGTRRWFRDTASAPLDWDALTMRLVRARGPRDTDLDRAPFLGWEASGIDGHFTAGEIQGVWIDSAGEPRAHFDAGSSLEWLCSDRVRTAWPVEGWSNLSDADAQTDLPGFDPAPTPASDGEDWRVGRLASAIVDAAQTTLGRRGQSGTWSLSLCDAETLEQVDFVLAPVSEEPSPERIARGAGRVAARWSALGHAVGWSIEYAAAGVALVRTEGQIDPAR